ncbi:GNAT family N-acetyltransferase [Psychrobacter sp. 1U2]|uniref:GNAT family N-acetyltransferase n=1 Tax=Psychrobacter sp. 1U2 TaxID=3453577 RepID=UPI003F44B6A2
MNLEYALVGDMSWQTQADWQAPDTPFMSFAFWQALSDTGAIGEKAGWLPIYVVVYDGDKHRPIAVMPVFVKGHHQGEFVFDYSWAQAYAHYGLDYYPRLVTSVPYTPISGQRLWLAANRSLTPEIIQTAIKGVDDIAQQVGASSWHCLFAESKLATIAASSSQEIAKVIDKSRIALAGEDGSQTQRQQPESRSINKTSLPILERQGCQFLWQNKNLIANAQPFTDFDDFLATLRAKKRKTIRAERRKVAEQNIVCARKRGSDITDSDWKAFYHCYVMTYAVRGQQPYLTLDFFMALASSMPEHLMLALAYDNDNEIIASSLFLYDKPDSEHSTLYGRYWGALADYDSLHFELCYYQGIAFAIEQGLQYFDPGTQGEHKLVRGFIPTTTHSLHRIYDERFIPAISNFCMEDRQRMAQYRQQAHEALPFNADNMPVFDSEQ